MLAGPAHRLAKARMRKTSPIGRNAARKDGRAKVTGAARYVDDYRFPGMLYGATVRSRIPAGEVAALRFDFDRSGFIVCDYRDIPGRNIVAAIAEDQPSLVEHTVRHVGEPILLLAHSDREKLLYGVTHVQVEYRENVPVFDPLQSTHAFKNLSISKGDI